jgi:hypothetical protein
MHGVAVSQEKLSEIAMQEGQQNFHLVCRTSNLLCHYFMTCFYFQGTQQVGQGALISADTVYFVKDSSANNHSIIAPWARPSELNENSVY